jgi:hypothetical protein
MIREEILNMPAGKEMDALIGEKVMGWHLIPDEYTDDDEGIKHWAQMWLDKDNKLMHNKYSPSTDISFAWEVVEKIKEKGRLYLIVSDDIGYKAEILLNDPVPMAIAECDTAPLAICRSALLAVFEL